MTISQLRKVGRRFGETTALHDIDLNIPRGLFVTILGPSGCGKSTTLRIIGGFEVPDTGQVLIEGKDVTQTPPYRRNVNMVFQDYALFPHLTVAENISFGLVSKGQPKSAIEKRTRELLELVRLPEMGKRYPDELSGGQRQRVALARALAPDPSILLLDEPLGALDAQLRQEMQTELRSLQQKTGKTFLLVTHDQDEAMTISDLIVVMNAGRIEQVGDPATLYHRPASEFVASFIGSNNIIDGSILSTRNGTAEIAALQSTIWAETSAEGYKEGDKVRFAVRPERLRCSVEEPTLRNRVRGRVTRRTFHGSRSIVVIDMDGDVELTAEIDSEQQKHLPGDRVWVGFEPNSAWILGNGSR